MKWLYGFLNEASDAELQQIYSSLHATRKQHIDRIRPIDDRRRSLMGELLIKRLLNDEFGISSPTVCQNERGMPYIKDSPLFISIAHSGNLVAVAADTESIGIDVEKMKPNDLKLVKRICLPNEEQYILSNPDKSLHRFYEIWTAKEAYFKKLGTGITDFKSIDTLTLNRHIFNIDDYLIQIV